MTLTKTLLTNYYNRQVIINTYEEECLIEKEGFAFDKITILSDQVQLIKDDIIIFSFDSSMYQFKVLDDFNHYYAFENELSKVELYFP
ncbi:hypothetical protein ACJ2A9_12065 [Anaerobacillus sp. MEB173]|uniref:hypothetical protein n=1 Tax=Anaerobacillus sp. MEB173 TaxID=3383345 RepID=UPI003F916041